MLAGWKYYKKITVTNSGSTSLTDYQIKVSLDNTNFDFSKANSDGSDIRFTDDDGTTFLKYWIENYDSTGETATIWVKVPSILGSDTKTIYLYYGNASATSESSFVNMFIEGDRFNRADNNTIGVTEIGNRTWTERYNNISGNFEIVSNTLKMVEDTGNPAYATIPFSQHTLTIEFDLYVPSGTSTNWAGVEIWKDNEADRYVNSGILIYFRDGGGVYIATNGTTSGTTSGTFTAGQWNHIIVKATDTAIEVYMEGTKVLDFTCSDESGGYVDFIDYKLDGVLWDNFFIRQYTSTEPTNSIGSEEAVANAIMFGMNF